ncbi:MAG TPA: tyrosine-protein phosphatase [Methyloceanibacter sp.]|nr:tyrosine-protein phosphatase [Methyloceanibacter sp.]
MVLLRKIIVRSVLGIVAIAGLYALYTVATGNFHTVIAGELYRSARPSAAQIASWHERYGIKTILNLQGAHPEDAWYREEVAAAKAHGIELINYKLSAQRDVTAVQLEELLDIMSNAERPILIHCRSGADRTGLVSAFYVAGIAGGSELYAEFQLTPYFGHFPFEFMSFYAMDRSFEAHEARLGIPDS